MRVQVKKMKKVLVYTFDPGLHEVFTVKVLLLCPPHWGVDILFLLFPASGVPLGFQTFQATVLILSLPNLACRFIGLIACMGLLLRLVMIAL